MQFGDHPRWSEIAGREMPIISICDIYTRKISMEPEHGFWKTSFLHKSGSRLTFQGLQGPTVHVWRCEPFFPCWAPEALYELITLECVCFNRTVAGHATDLCFVFSPMWLVSKRTCHRQLVQSGLGGELRKKWSFTGTGPNLWPQNGDQKQASKVTLNNQAYLEEPGVYSMHRFVSWIHEE